MLFSILCVVSNAQNFAYKAGFGFYFDNLENSTPWTPTRTNISVSLNPEVGVVFGKHSFMVGTNMIQNLGDSSYFSQVDVIAYYRYKSKVFNGFAGALQREYSIASYPKSFFRDDVYFYDPVIEGVMLQYMNKKKTGYVEFFLDWYGLNNTLRIDEFMLCAASEYSFANKLFFVGAAGQIIHFKNDYKLKDSYLMERTYYNLYAGSDLASVIPFFDEARVSVGLLGSMEHKRILDTETSWTNNPGAQIDLSLRWKSLGVQNSFYFGKPQMKYYTQYGDDMYWGSPFYQSKRYNRTDIYWKWDHKFFNIKADFILHYDGRKMASQQMLTLGVKLHQKLVKGKTYNID